MLSNWWSSSCPPGSTDAQRSAFECMDHLLKESPTDDKKAYLDDLISFLAEQLKEFASTSANGSEVLKRISALSEAGYRVQELASKFISPSHSPSPEAFLPIQTQPATAWSLWTSPYFYDGDHPWKQEKYRVALAWLGNAITNERQCTLSQLIFQIAQAHSPLKDPLSLVLGSILFSQSNPRSSYQSFLTNLRELLQYSAFNELLEQGDSCAQMAQQLCFHRFTSVQLASFNQNLMGLIVHESQKSNSDAPEIIDFARPLAELIRDGCLAVEKTPPEYGAPRLAVAKEKAKGQFGWNFDPQLGANTAYTPYRLLLQNGEAGTRSATFLRFGTPTIQDGMIIPGLKTTSIDPVFRSFLSYLQTQKQKIIYFNLQEMITRYCGGDESTRSQAIKALEQEFPGTFYFFALSQDSEFYHQSGSFAEETNAQRFFSSFFSQLQGGEKCGFCLPADQDLMGHLHLCGMIHEAIFDSRETLTREERQDFIEIYYTLFCLKLICELQADFYGCFCKDSIDRGAKLATLILFLFSVLAGDERGQETREQIYFNTLAPAFLVKKQPMVKGRRQRLLSALARLEIHAERICIEWKPFFEELALKPAAVKFLLDEAEAH